MISVQQNKKQVLPDLAVIVLMAVILGFTAASTLKKGITSFREQRAANAIANATTAEEKEDAVKLHKELSAKNKSSVKLTPKIQPLPDPEPASEERSSDSPSTISPKHRNGQDATSTTQNSRDLTAEQWKEKDAKFPWRSVWLLVVMWLVPLCKHIHPA